MFNYRIESKYTSFPLTGTCQLGGNCNSIDGTNNNAREEQLHAKYEQQLRKPHSLFSFLESNGPRHDAMMR